MNEMVKKIAEYLPTYQSGLQKKFDELFGPQLNHQYFLNKKNKPFHFNFKAEGFDGVNAAWMADAALLAYVPNPIDKFSNFNLTKEEEKRCKDGLVEKKLNRSGMKRVKFFNKKGTQCFIADNDDWVVVSFRGTEVDEPIDVVNDFTFILKEESKGKVHRGFQKALNAVWKSVDGKKGVEEYLKNVSNDAGKPVFITGHSLGAVIAIIAAARWKKNYPLQGLYTFGSPGVGNKPFVDCFEGINAIRVVHNEDMVTKVSQDPELYHVGKLYMIGPDGKVKPMPGRPSDKTKIILKAGQIIQTETSRLRKAIFQKLIGQGGAVQMPRCLADHSPKFYSNYIRSAAR